MGPHGIPRSCQLSSQASDGSSFEAQLSDHPADRPHTQTRPGGAHPLVMFQERHRLAGVFAAYPSALKPPQPCRDPGPGRVDHLHHHTPVALSDLAHNPGTPQPGHPQLVARLNIEHQSLWGANHAHQMETLQTDEQITPIKQHTAAAGRVGHRPRALKTAGVEVRSSPGTSTSTRNPPTNTYSPTLNSEEPLNSCRNHLIPTKIAHRRFISFFTPSECDTASQTLTKEYASGLRGAVNKTAGAYVPRPQVPTHPIERDSPCAPTRLACVS